MPNFEKPRVIVDASPLRYLNTGLGQFTFHLLRELELLSPLDYNLFALVHPKYRDLVPKEIQIEGASWLRRHAPAGIHRYLYGPCAVWHMTTENARHIGIPRKAAFVLTIHGLHFLDEESEEKATLQLMKVQELINRAEVITVVSEFTASLVKEKLNIGGRRIQVIPNGVSFGAEPPRIPDWAPRKKFLFAIGTFFKRKNLHVIVSMMKLLPEYALVLAGDANHDYGNFIVDMIKEEGLQDEVIVPGEITDSEKSWLYENGKALLFPSVSEGFGIPIIEAFQKGTPVFCSRYGSLPEIGGELAYYWDNFDPQQMAAQVKKRLDGASVDEEKRKNYARQFTWSSAAKTYSGIYSDLLKERK